MFKYVNPVSNCFFVNQLLLVIVGVKEKLHMLLTQLFVVCLELKVPVKGNLQAVDLVATIFRINYADQGRNLR